MNILRLISGHVYDWSVKFFRKIILGTTKAPAIAAAKAPAFGCGVARLADRALQALRQARLQVRRRSRSRPEVLPVGELSRRATADGLRAARRSGRDPHAGGELPSGAYGARGSLRDQPRTVAAPRGAVRARGERSAPIAHAIDRHRRRRAAPCQHARGVARGRATLSRSRGGNS
jgi:hypothetical protein